VPDQTCFFPCFKSSDATKKESKVKKTKSLPADPSVSRENLVPSETPSETRATEEGTLDHTVSVEEPIADGRSFVGTEGDISDEGSVSSREDASVYSSSTLEERSANNDQVGEMHISVPSPIKSFREDPEELEDGTEDDVSFEDENDPEEVLESLGREQTEISNKGAELEGLIRQKMTENRKLLLLFFSTSEIVLFPTNMPSFPKSPKKRKKSSSPSGLIL